MEALLRLENISKTYQNQDTPAVQNVSFDVKQGEFFSIVGESGSGKTTLLNLISALDAPNTGNIFLRDENIKPFALYLVKGHPQIKPVFQHYNLLPYHKIWENITYPLRRYKTDYQQYRTQELLQLCRLEAVADKIPRELSGGEQQRTALAVALAQNPTLITADEPFSNLDNLLKERFRAEFQRIIREAGVTIIFVTHDVRDALSLSDRIAVMEKGQLIQMDTPQNIYQNPVNEYVARLFGKVNVIPKSIFETYFRKESEQKNQQTSDTAFIFIRPERLAFCHVDEAILEDKIIHRMYFGNYYLYKIEHPEIELVVQSLDLQDIDNNVFIKSKSS